MILYGDLLTRFMTFFFHQRGMKQLYIKFCRGTLAEIEGPSER